jgi:starch-binding outer membrane protein, SusD/RagB family
MPNTTPAPRRLARLAALAAVAAGSAAAGCGDILEVDNPNNVNVEALSNPASATNQVNGVLAALTRGAHQLTGHLVTISDEMTWSGSLDFMNQLNRGSVRDPYNEFITDAASGMSTARYMADRTIKQLEEFQAARTLTDPVQLALANLYGAVTYDYLANGFDNFVVNSDRQQGGPAVGADKMAVLYDSADAMATRALAIAPASNALLRGQILAVRARARYDKAVWQKLNPSGRTPADPLVNVQGAVDDATAALPLLGADGRLALTVVAGMSYGNCFLPSCTNNRREIAFNPVYGSYAYTTTRTLTVNLRDPISNQPDPALAALMTEFVTGTNNNNQFTNLVVTGARDMRLILAEAALSRGNTAEFTAQINALRALNSKPAWTGAAGQPSARDLLLHERRVNLYLQGRRLNDMYRFGVKDPEWSAQSDAATCPGSLFPIVDAERQTNANVADVQPGCGQ